MLIAQEGSVAVHSPNAQSQYNKRVDIGLFVAGTSFVLAPLAMLIRSILTQ